MCVPDPADTKQNNTVSLKRKYTIAIRPNAKNLRRVIQKKGVVPDRAPTFHVAPLTFIYLTWPKCILSSGIDCRNDKKVMTFCRGSSILVLDWKLS